MTVHRRSETFLRMQDAAPSRWHVVEAGAVEPTPWRNGGGFTRELLRLPANGRAAVLADPAEPGRCEVGGGSPPGDRDDWMLRISVADIAADGPFSRFPGVDRWFAVLSGAGVALDWGKETGAPSDVVAPASAPLHFEGEHAPGCRLLDGPTRDLNVMARRDFARVRLEAAHWKTGWQPRTPAAGVFARVPLQLRAGGGPARMLPAETLAWCEQPDETAWTIVPAGTERGSQAQTGAGGAPPAWWIAFSPVRLPAC